jgi:hypothetical protein
MRFKYLSNNNIFYLLLLLSIIVSTVLNYKADVMGPMVVLYEDYANFFSNKFNFTTPFKYSQYTFPMWGYGFVILILKKKIWIIIFQQLVTFFTLIFFDSNFNHTLKNKNSFRFFLLVSFPWFFFHTSLWPYSLGANFLLIGVTLIFKYYNSQKKYLLLFSAIIFGLMLNLRSDYYYFIILLFTVLIIQVIIQKKRKEEILLILTWFLVIQMFLIPWGYYTFKRTGHYLQTSTNAGHVFFISLGQLPNNLWKITQEDNDSTMYSYLKKEFPSKNTNSLAYEEDKFLFKSWKSLVLNNPKEYFKKCFYNCYRVIRNPFYVGNLETLVVENARNKYNVKEKLKKLLDKGDLNNIIKYIFLGAGSIYITSFFINLFSIYIFLLFFYYLLRASSKVNIKNDYVSTIILLLILYQNLMSIFVFFMPIYNTNLYIFYLFGIFYYRSKLIDYSKS